MFLLIESITYAMNTVEKKINITLKTTSQILSIFLHYIARSIGHML